MNPRTLAMALALAAPALAAAAPGPASFRWSRAVDGAPEARTAVAAAPLDAAVFAGSADEFRDVRLFDNAGIETPRAIERLRAVRLRTERRPVNSKLISLRELPDNRLEAEFELSPADAVADGFTVATPLRDFHHTVRVESRAADGEWTPQVDGAPLFDASRYMDLRHLDVELPAAAGPRFRVTIDQVAGEAARPLTRLVTQTGGREDGMERREVELQQRTFRVDRVSFWRHETVEGAAEDVRAEWPLTEFSVGRDEKERATWITIETGRLPLNRLTLEFAERNFSRTVRAERPAVRDGVASWTAFASGRLLDVELAGLSRSETSIDFGETRCERIRLVLRDGDSPPLTVRSVTGSGPEWRVLFLAEPGRAYRLAYGAPRAAAPAYDIDAVLAPVRLGLRPTEWTLGAPVENEAFRPERSPFGWLNSTWTFGAAIVLAMLALGAMLVRTARARPPEE